MKFRTFLSMSLLVMFSLWTLHVFIFLIFFESYYIAKESILWVAIVEAMLCIGCAALGVERLINIRESK